MGNCKACEPYVEKVNELDFVKEGVAFAKDKYARLKTGLSEIMGGESSQAPKEDNYEDLQPKIQELGGEEDYEEPPVLRSKKKVLKKGAAKHDENEANQVEMEVGQDEDKPEDNPSAQPKLRAGRPKASGGVKKTISKQTVNGVTTITETVVDQYGNKTVTKRVEKSGGGGDDFGDFGDFGNFGKGGNYGDFFSGFGGNSKKNQSKNPYLEEEDDNNGWKIIQGGNSNKKNPYLEEDDDYQPKKKIINNKKNPYLEEDDDYQPMQKIINNKKNPYLEDDGDYQPKKKVVSSTGKRGNDEQVGGSDFVKGCIAAHNEYRRLHGAPDLTEDPELTKIAQRYAEKLASTDSFQHSGADFNGDSMGENLYMASWNFTPQQMTKSWYDEIKDYDYAHGEQTWSGCGHFTQVVWKGTKRAGFGIAKGRSGYYGVGNYYPAGNLWGTFSKNVLPPQ